MSNHPHRTNSVFTLDGYTGDWLVNQGELRLREGRNGRVHVLGSTITRNVSPPAHGSMALGHPTQGGVAVVLSHNTRRHFQPLVDKIFPDMKTARTAVLAAMGAAVQQRQAANEALLKAAGLEMLVGTERKRALARLKKGTPDQG